MRYTLKFVSIIRYRASPGVKGLYDDGLGGVEC